MRRTGFGLKAATITPESADDVSSPNAILRKEVDGKVIVRTGRRIPNVRPTGGVHSPITVVRMAVDDAYGAEEWRESRDGEEWAYRTEKISRQTCHAVAEYSFYHARRTGAKVFGGPKWTVSPVYEGLLKEAGLRIFTAGLQPGRCAVVTNPIVAEYHAKSLLSALRGAGFDPFLLEVPDGVLVMPGPDSAADHRKPRNIRHCRLRVQEYSSAGRRAACRVQPSIRPSFRPRRSRP